MGHFSGIFPHLDRGTNNFSSFLVIRGFRLLRLGASRRDLVIFTDRVLLGEVWTEFIWGFPARHGGSPIAGCFLIEKSHLEMDDDWGYPKMIYAIFTYITG